MICLIYFAAVGQAPERVKYVHKISMKVWRSDCLSTSHWHDNSILTSASFIRQEKKKERKKSADTSRATPKFVEVWAETVAKMVLL